MTLSRNLLVVVLALLVLSLALLATTGGDDITTAGGGGGGTRPLPQFAPAPAGPGAVLPCFIRPATTGACKR